MRNLFFIGSKVAEYWLDNRSHMSRECHVRFCEHLGGQFPGVTRLVMFSALLSTD